MPLLPHIIFFEILFKTNLQCIFNLYLCTYYFFFFFYKYLTVSINQNISLILNMAVIYLSLLHLLHIKTSRGYTYGPFSTLMERIFLKSLSRMFWHSNVNSQLLPWKYSSSNTVILNFPFCSKSSCGFMADVDHRTLYQENEERGA